MSELKQSKRSGTPAGIRESLKKATTELLVLFVLYQKPMYTYEMMQEIDRMSQGKLTFNTLYQAIYRLQDHGHIQEEKKVLSEDNRVRIYFAITPAGTVYLSQLLREYRAFTATLDDLLAQGQTPPEEESP
jgi:PadR family transcriptional regulator PadR